MIYLVTSLHYQELIEAADPMTARTLMQVRHPDDGEYNCYRATPGDIQLFARTHTVVLRPRRRTKLRDQLDWIEDL